MVDLAPLHQILAGTARPWRLVESQRAGIVYDSEGLSLWGPLPREVATLAASVPRLVDEVQDLRRQLDGVKHAGSWEAWATTQEEAEKALCVSEALRGHWLALKVGRCA